MTLALGDDGAGELHQRLIEAGYLVAEEELDAGRFGISTREAVREFQAAHVDAGGLHLVVDGVAGPATWWALEHPGATTDGGPKGYLAPGWRCEPSEARPEVREAIHAAVGELGNHEDPDGSNRGPQVNLYGQNGQPWCAYFLSWAFARLAEGSPFGIIGSAYGLQQWGDRRRRLVLAPAPLLPGDVGVILRAPEHPGDRPRGHVALIVHVEAGQLCTVEGNSSNAVRGIVCARLRFGWIVRPVPLL